MESGTGVQTSVVLRLGRRTDAGTGEDLIVLSNRITRRCGGEGGRIWAMMRAAYLCRNRAGVIQRVMPMSHPISAPRNVCLRHLLT
jgi:hypothetical protein